MRKTIKNRSKEEKKEAEYWERVLKYHRLGVHRGRARMVYVGGSRELAAVEEQQIVRRTGRVRPKRQAD